MPNGDFQLYKPGTDYTVTATFADGNNYAQGVGDNLQVLGDGIANYGDGTSGGSVDLPVWVGQINETNKNDLWSAGVAEDGTTCFNAFGAWSGGNGALGESADPLTVPGLSAGQFYELSAMVAGPAGPRVLELLVDSVPLAPSSSVDPAASEEWQKMSRTYDSIPAGDVKVLIGIDKLGDQLYGSRLRIDNVSFGVVPEPATLLLLGLGGLGLACRRKL